MFAALRWHSDAGRAGWHLPGLAAGVTPQSNSMEGVGAVAAQRSHHVDVAPYSASSTTWLGGYRVLAATVLNRVCSWLHHHGRGELLMANWRRADATAALLRS